MLALKRASEPGPPLVSPETFLPRPAPDHGPRSSCGRGRQQPRSTVGSREAQTGVLPDAASFMNASDAGTSGEKVGGRTPTKGSQGPRIRDNGAARPASFAAPQHVTSAPRSLKRSKDAVEPAALRRWRVRQCVDVDNQVRAGEFRAVEDGGMASTAVDDMDHWRVGRTRGQGCEGRRRLGGAITHRDGQPVRSVQVCDRGDTHREEGDPIAHRRDVHPLLHRAQKRLLRNARRTADRGCEADHEYLVLKPVQTHRRSVGSGPIQRWRKASIGMLEGGLPLGHEFVDRGVGTMRGSASNGREHQRQDENDTFRYPPSKPSADCHRL
ncbi:hypothetical protein SI859A1_01292 [Aurantimonas manganoxydans SI85-9A1]|uniref:Uncharacterized protein n=1 Tax=Aurantimonas manganoxydans (strain ATCC BAA-1229 / DSM 21871 / SI85-9A1) TaxID=287752 RepID=Q1YJ28_AURMS|nr:hypothetical protein SI859A1_01292 [Aurantimonas manganoxydans SI85-9A1]